MVPLILTCILSRERLWVILAQKKLVSAGCQEVVLTGVDITSYGADLPGTPTLGKLAREKNAWIVAGIVEREGSTLYNTAILLDRAGRVAGKYRKVYLPREEIEGGVTPGNSYPVFETDFGKIGMMICWDVQYADPARNLALKGAEARGLLGVKGHRRVGGMRISNYNAVPVDAVKQMTQYLLDYAKDAGTKQGNVNGDIQRGD